MKAILGVCRLGALSAAALALAASMSMAQTRIDLGLFHAERSPWTPTIEWWIDEVATATEGRVEIVPHYAGALARLNETLGAVRNGSVPAGLIAAAAVSGELPFMAFPEALGGLPIDPVDQGELFVELRPILTEALRDEGVDYLWSQTSGTVLIVCRDGHLKTPADWEARRIRSAGRWQGEQVQLAGGRPVAIDPAEQYIALQNRTIDCALSVTPIALPLRLYEVAPYVTMLQMSVNLSSYIVNSDVFARLSEEDREAILAASVEAEQRSAAAMAEADAAALAEMEANGANVYVLNDDEVALLTEAFAPAFETMRAESGEIGARVDEITRGHR